MALTVWTPLLPLAIILFLAAAALSRADSHYDNALDFSGLPMGEVPPPPAALWFGVDMLPSRLPAPSQHGLHDIDSPTALVVALYTLQQYQFPLPPYHFLGKAGRISDFVLRLMLFPTPALEPRLLTSRRPP